MMMVLVIGLMFITQTMAISSANLQQCKDMFISDKEYVKQRYLQEHPKLKDSEVFCDCWGCHNTSNCYWNDGYWGDGQWWWVWIIFFVCIIFFFFGFLLVALLSSGAPWLGPSYSSGYPSSVTQKVSVDLIEGAQYTVRDGKIVRRK